MEALNRYLDDLAGHLPRGRALREAVLAVWGRRRRLWVAPWIGYGLAVALALAILFRHALGIYLWLGLAGLAFFWLAYRDRLAGVLAAVPLVPVAFTMLALDEVQPPLASVLVLAAGLLAALATGVAIRMGDERRGILLLAAANALVAAPASWATMLYSEHPMMWIGYPGRITPAAVSITMSVYLAFSTLLLLGPLFCRALIDWGVTIVREARGGKVVSSNAAEAAPTPPEPSDRGPSQALARRAVIGDWGWPAGRRAAGPLRWPFAALRQGLRAGVGARSAG